MEEMAWKGVFVDVYVFIVLIDVFCKKGIAAGGRHRRCLKK